MAMGAGVFAPRFLGGVAAGIVPAGLVSPLAGAATYYVVAEEADAQAMLIGAAAGYAGPMIAIRVAPQLLYG